jgi:HEAT repeat protein
MTTRILTPFLFAIILTSGFLTGCSQDKYEDSITGLTVRKLGSDLDNHWAFEGVVVDAIKPDSPADGALETGELISYIVDERRVEDEREYRNALREALDEDDEAILRFIKNIPITMLKDIGIQIKPDPEERGVIIDSFDVKSKAEQVGLKPQTVIYEINGEAVKSIQQYNNIMSKILSGSGEAAFNISRNIVASKLSEVGIEDVEKRGDGVAVTKMDEEETQGTPASMEGIAVGDVITHVIDEMEITDIKSYKKAVKKATEADRVVLKRGELGGIKLVVIDALGQIGASQAVNTLVKALGSEDRWIRRAAAGALENINDESIVEPLMWHLLEENEPDVEVRRSAARALATMEPVSAIEPLAKALKDSSMGVRLDAGYALGRIGEPSIDVLVEALKDEDSRVRDSAVAALGNIGGNRARNEIIEVLRDADEESTVKLTAIQALNKIGDSESISELRRIASTGDPELRPFVKELLTEGRV